MNRFTGTARLRVLLLGLSAALLLAIGTVPALAQNQTCPTAPNGDSSNKCASTAFVQNSLGASLPLPNGDIFIGNASNLATARALGAGVATALGIPIGSPGAPMLTAAGTAGFALTGNGSSAATFQGFLQAGAGAVTRTWQSKAADNINVADFGAKCDGSTDDTAAFAAALVAANRKVLSFPAGAVCVVQHLDICSNATCQTGIAGGSVPLIVEGNGATLLAPASTAGAATFVYVEMQTATNVANFALRDLIINAGGFASRGLTVVGCVYCSFVNIGETNAQIIGCHFNAMVGFVLANSLFERVQCNTNNTNSGTVGVGILEDTTATFLGPSSCTANAQNAGNTFVSVHALFNGLLGWDVDCANNTHINPDMEQNLSFGLSLAQVTASEWIGAQFSSNKNNRGAAGTGGDASVINNDGSPGIQFFGGASDGTFTAVSAGHGDTLAMHGQTGFGYTANCNGTSNFCMTLP